MGRTLEGRLGPRTELAVGFATVTHTVDGHDPSRVVNREEDPVVADTQAVVIPSCELFNMLAPRLIGEEGRVLKDRPAVYKRNPTQILLNASVVGKLVHRLEEMLSLELLEQFAMGDGATARTDGPLEGFGVFLVVNEAH